MTSKHGVLVVMRCGRLLRQWCCYLVIGVFLVLAIVIIQEAYRSCSMVTAYEVQLDLCSMYHRHEIDGNICSPLCDNRQLTLDYCANDRNKKHVNILKNHGFVLDQRVSKIVMKINLDYNEWKKETDSVLGNVRNINSMLNKTKIRIQSEIQYLGDFITHDEFLAALLSYRYRQDRLSLNNYKSAYTTLKTIIALVMQKEVISLIAFRNSSFIPKVYGYCGPALFTEYTPSINSIGYVVTSSAKSPDRLNMLISPFRSWPERLLVALQVLDIVKRVKTLGSKPLHMCDIKTSNVGLNTDKNVVLLDADEISFDIAIGTWACKTDDDCVFLYCIGYCNVISNTCMKSRRHNNLQRFCQNVFLADSRNYLGLLRYPPEIVRQELNDLLLRCAYPQRYQDLLAEDELSRRIENLLKRSTQDT